MLLLQAHDIHLTHTLQHRGIILLNNYFLSKYTMFLIRKCSERGYAVNNKSRNHDNLSLDTFPHDVMLYPEIKF